MRKRRILAMLLAVCMILQSTTVAFASETDPLSEDKAAIETETPTEAPTPGSGEQTPPAVDGAADSETGNPEEVTSGEQLPAETPEKPEDGAGEGQIPGEGTEQDPVEETEQPPAEGAEQPPVEEPDGAMEQEPDAAENPADAPEELVPEEANPEGASQVMSETDPLADEEITQGGIDMEITNLKLRQEYGVIGLVWKYRNTASPEVSANFRRCRVYRSESENGSYVLLGETDGTDGHDTYLDDTVERVAGGAANKTYYYKVSVVYSRSEKDENDIWGEGKLYESKLSNPVSNKDAYYFEWVSPLNDEPEHVGVYVTDDDGNRLDSITLKEGKVTSLRVKVMKADGTEGEKPETGKCYSTWLLCKQYYTGKEIAEKRENEFECLGEDKVAVFPEMGDEGVDDTHVYLKALSGSAGSNTYYLIYKLEGYAGVGNFVWQIPVRIEAGDGSEDPIENKMYTTREPLCQVIRDTLVSREKAVLYATGGNEWWDESEGYSYEDVFDFHREREGMKPYEGDYLNLAIGDADSEVCLVNWIQTDPLLISWRGQYLTKYTVTPQFITTRAQEDQVDQKINALIYTEGGALYNYRNASDYAKVKAAYDYVRGHVSYIGTKTPIYHTCYSALINGKATCQGYALLFYRLVRELGVPCRVLMGTDANAHTYNIVQMDGGAWYYVDTNAGVLLKGTDDFKPATLQSQYLTSDFKAEYISKISKESYAGTETAVSGLEKAESLTAAEIQAIDANLTAAAAERMTAAYTINGAAIKASGTVKYLEGCSKYLGYEEDKNMPTSGYFLSLKLTANASKFKDDGKLTVSYVDPMGVRKESSYAKADLADAVKLIVNVSENPGMKIRVDYDGDGETSKYDEMVYDLDLSGLKKESRAESSGAIKEVNKYGIELSAPIVKKSADGKTIDVTYEAVAYSDRVKWKEGAAEEKGNYIALQLKMPESVKATAMAKNLTITTDDGTARAAQALTEGWNEAAGCYMEAAADHSEVFLAMPVEKSFQKSFTIRWGGAAALAFEQTLTVSVPSESALETRSESALLPGTLAFNGLATTMYVGQSQNSNITFKKKYEQDEIQVFYTTDAADVATVNRITGVLKALKPGTANITVSAVDKSGNVITKTAKITVKELPAPTGISTTLIRDHDISLKWKANTTGQYTEVYAIPYKLTTFGTNKKGWKDVVENALKATGMDAISLNSLDDTQKAEKIKALQENLGTGAWSAAAVPAKDSSVVLKGLQAETEYVLYLRNVSETAASTLVFSGVTNGRTIKTTSPVFTTLRLQLKSEDGTVLAESAPESAPAVVYEVTDTDTPVVFSYQMLDENGTEMSPAPVFTNMRYTSGNGGIVSVSAPKNSPAKLKYGSQVGETVLMVTGKDASGMLRPSEQIRVRVVKAPEKLKDKSTTLTIGQSISIKELIGTDLKGTTLGVNLGAVDFDAALTELTKSGCFAITYPTADNQAENKAEDAIITAKALINGKSGNKLEVLFRMGSSQAKAKIQIKDMEAASITKITVKDTSAQITFKPSAAVSAIEEGSRYYTLQVTDKLTGETVTAAATETEGNPYTCTFQKEESGKTWICGVKGLSGNKTYEAVITAHYDVNANEKNDKSSKAKKFTTKKPLLVSEGSIDVNYVSLDQLRKNPNEAGMKIDYEAEGGIVLENNGTYVFMAQVSNLARTLETDKLKWTISSGDKKAASVKASSSSYEMQLTTKRTGTFTVTAASTSTKEPVATFMVTVVPYQSQSGGAGAPVQPEPAPDQSALLPEMYTEDMFKMKREDAA